MQHMNGSLERLESEGNSKAIKTDLIVLIYCLKNIDKRDVK